MSNSHPKMSGANMPAPSPSALAWPSRRSHEPIPLPPGTDLGNSDPNSQPHPAALHRQLLPIPGPWFPAVSPHPLSAAPPAFPTAPRPHLLGWFRCLCAHPPPLSNQTRIDYLVRLRRLLDGLAANGHSLPPDLIRREDFPPRPHYLPKPLPPEDDHRLHQELRRTDDLPAHALLLTRATGIRIGECIDLPLDGL